LDGHTLLGGAFLLFLLVIVVRWLWGLLGPLVTFLIVRPLWAIAEARGFRWDRALQEPVAIGITSVSLGLWLLGWLLNERKRERLRATPPAPAAAREQRAAKPAFRPMPRVVLRPEQLPLLDLRPDPERARTAAPKVTPLAAPRPAVKPSAPAAKPRFQTSRTQPGRPPAEYRGCIRLLEPEPPPPPPSDALRLAPAVVGEPPEEKGLTQAEWHASDDADALLAHLLNRVPIRHSALVFAAIVERLWPIWNRAYPDDWSITWVVAVLRAWSLGEATMEEVQAARRAAHGAYQRWGKERRRLPEGDARFAAHRVTRMAICACVYAEAEHPEDLSAAAAEDALWWASSIGVDANGEVRAVEAALELANDADSPVAEFSGFALEALTDRVRERARRKNTAPFAELIRKLVAYPWRCSLRWERDGSWIRSGDALLRTEGWNVVEVRTMAAPPRSPETCWN
jgi:hypothetical protein